VEAGTERCVGRVARRDTRKEHTVSNTTLEQDVKDELWYDPMIDAAQIAVSAADGVVTLRGTVGSLPQKIGAGRDAKRVSGVREVKNDLDVRLVVGDEHDDAELRAKVLQAFVLNSQVPSTVDAEVKDDYVTLKGRVEWNFERQAAEAAAGNVPGVRGVRSEIVLAPAPNVSDIEQTITQAYQRIATLDADNLSVRGSNGTVTLSGWVSSWAEHDAAIDAAWSAPGVTAVKDEIDVRY
jgi:osmotically-inducible protein OsmY